MTEQAQAIGKRGQDFMENINMDRVYDYMFHLITEYSKLQDFKPVPPPSAMEVCTESLLCLADDKKQKQFLERTTAYPSPISPCTLQPADSNLIRRWRKEKEDTVQAVEDMSILSGLPMP